MIQKNVFTLEKALRILQKIEKKILYNVLYYIIY
jgi:hypothetical protein